MRNSTDLYRSFGFDTQPVLIGLIIFQVHFKIWSFHLNKKCLLDFCWMYILLHGNISELCLDDRVGRGFEYGNNLFVYARIRVHK